MRPNLRHYVCRDSLLLASHVWYKFTSVYIQFAKNVVLTCNDEYVAIFVHISVEVVFSATSSILGRTECFRQRHLVCLSVCLSISKISEKSCGLISVEFFRGVTLKQATVD